MQQMCCFMQQKYLLAILFRLSLQQKPKVGIANKHFKCYVRKLASKSANAHRNPSEVQQSV